MHLAGRPPPANIGDRIRGARVFAGLTRAELAWRLDRSVSTVRRIEDGERWPTKRELTAIAEVCEVPAYLLVEEWDWERKPIWPTLAP